MNTAQSTDNASQGDILSSRSRETSVRTLTSSATSDLLNHLRAEETTLALLLDAVRAVWQSLVARDDEQLGLALEAEARGFQMCEVMRDRRRQFCLEIAVPLNIAPEQISLTQLLECASIETREQALQVRNRLTEMSTELALLNRQNAAMIRQSLDLTRGIIGELTGHGPHLDGYNASGKSETGHVGPVMQWGG